ncbi:hypothetical protein QR680_016319 [Steinernema hermaphroditum]|uniref:Uncharacterized protein n=1 Tax=Steinernema hermaphroditum TaxID=289476 RepID=A0AA39LMD5_9BILA|nr:hypothetical protein QR680_016319 [Steinernema hermaphroditum]
MLWLFIGKSEYRNCMAYQIMTSAEFIDIFHLLADFMDALLMFFDKNSNVVLHRKSVRTKEIKIEQRELQILLPAVGMFGYMAALRRLREDFRRLLGCKSFGYSDKWATAVVVQVRQLPST